MVPLNILYATDGSEGALAGARLLARLPLPADARVTLLTVLPEIGEMDAEAAQAATRAALQGTAVSIQPVVRRGHAAQEILSAAEGGAADLVVVGSRGLTGLARYFVGSVAERVARHAACPVLLARPLVDDLRQAIVGIDGSEAAAGAADWLRQFPLPHGCTVRLVTAMRYLWGLDPSRKLRWPAEIKALYEQQYQEARERLDGLVASFAGSGRQSSAEVIEGEPADVLLRSAEEQKADLIVVGASGANAVQRFLLGSVAEKVLRYAPCSVLVVKEHAPR
jgi:nucleotide-binding universal stress UspA family protein